MRPRCLFSTRFYVKVWSLLRTQILSCMQIFWHGLSCIRLEAKTTDVEATLLTDPYDNETGLRFPRTVEADLTLLSHQDRKLFNLETSEHPSFVISDPGEYEVKGIFVHGIQDPAQGKDAQRPVAYRIDAEGISLAFLGHWNRALTNDEIDQLGDVDILLLPVGGGSVLDANAAASVISAVEPRMVIPLFYELPGLKEKLASVDVFCKKLGVAQRQDMNKLKIVKKDLPTDDMIVTVLERA